MTTQIRAFQKSDLPFADQLRAQANWNQTHRDWERFLACEPAGCFVAEWDGHRAGTVVVSCYGTEVSWIGMLLVHPDYRRHGIGSALLEHCLHFLSDRKVRCVKLDATPLGRRLYERVGFTTEWALARWETASALPADVKAKDCQTRAGAESDLEAIVSLDQKAFGAFRRSVLSKLANDSIQTLVLSAGRDKLGGFGMLRRGALANYLGPVAACNARFAEVLIRQLLDSVAGQPVFWDVPGTNGDAIALARRLGFKTQRPLLRMVRGENSAATDPQSQFAIADPAVG